MENETKMESLLKAALAGDREAEAEFFSKLFVRFLPLITSELQGNAILKKSIDIENGSREVCQTSINNLKRVLPISSQNWSMKRAVIFLHNDIDDFIIMTLTDLAKAGDSAAENSLFMMIRKKLMERIVMKGRRFSQHESKNE